MKGKHVLRKAGWDTHGLPVELEVEKLLGLDGKEQIEEYGIEPFIQECKKSVWKYKGEWERMSDRVGLPDMDKLYHLRQQTSSPSGGLDGKVVNRSHGASYGIEPFIQEKRPPWDTHGLVELEKMLGLDGKEQIEEYGIEPFIQEGKKSVWKYKSEWEKMSDRVGFWADMDDPYITYDNNYIESVWWSLKQVADKGLLYKGHKVVPYCPRCGTALSSHEVSQGYKTVTEKSAFVRFKVKGEENTWLYAWTTTPWTLPSNVALCVNPDEILRPL